MYGDLAFFILNGNPEQKSNIRFFLSVPERSEVTEVMKIAIRSGKCFGVAGMCGKCFGIAGVAR